MRPHRAEVLWEGFVAGVLGYATVAAFFGVFNMVEGRSFFFTAALLGEALIGPVVPPGEVSVTAGPVLAYNGVHLLAFLIIGIGAAWLVIFAEEHPGLWYVVFFLFLAGFFFSVALVLLYASPVAEAMPWGSVLGANAAAALAMGGYLLKAHPRVWRDSWQERDPERAGGG
jgi:hypothetical protein